MSEQNCENCKHYEPKDDGEIWGHCYVNKEQPEELTSYTITQRTENCDAWEVE